MLIIYVRRKMAIKVIITDMDLIRSWVMKFESFGKI